MRQIIDCMRIVQVNIGIPVFTTLVKKVLIPDLPDHSAVVMDNIA